MNRIGVVAFFILGQLVLSTSSPLAGQGTVCPVPSCSLRDDSNHSAQSSVARNPTLKKTGLSDSSEAGKIRGSVDPVGTGSGLWDWADSGPHHEAVVEISSAAGAGTGVLITTDRTKLFKNGYIGYVLTAWHVIQNDIVDGKLKLKYRNSIETHDCTVMRHSEEKDIAILRVWVPQGIREARLATVPIQRGDRLELVGLGGGTNLTHCLRAFKSAASPPSSREKIFADVPLLPGDSGGPIFNAQHEVVGVISGGWFWWDSGITTPDGGLMRTTWPARASNVEPIRRMLRSLSAPASVADIAPTLRR